MNQKLELTWIGKGEEDVLEPRILIENPQYSYGDPSTGNLLIHGDNLLALKSLVASGYAGKVKCIYIDPPYNTGSAFEHYDDNVEHSIWLSLMKQRLELLRVLLHEQGSIWIQIDDEEQAYLKILCDEVFGRENFINMLSVNMKNIAGASGGGEDKKMKKNCEYILVYSKNYSVLPLFNGPYEYIEISDLIQQYSDKGKSWKYTSVLVYSGDKIHIGSTSDGVGNEINIYRRDNVVISSIKSLAKKDGLSLKEAYKKYALRIFRTTNSQSSIRNRVMDYRKKENISAPILSIEYVPKTGRNKGEVYEQFYKDDVCNLFVWLKDTAEIIDGNLYKKNLLGTYWDMNSWMKNLTKEGGVSFPNGKKPEQLICQIFNMTTAPGDLVLDSFLGSGTTAAVAHKMDRRYIGIELGNHAYTHCVPRLKKVIDGTDKGGVTSETSWTSGGGFRFYELAPTLIKTDNEGIPIINPEYNADMLAAAMAMHEGFCYAPDPDVFWKQGYSTEHDFIYTTTQHLTIETMEYIDSLLGEDETILICCASHSAGLVNRFPRITVKRIPRMLLGRCVFDPEKNYNLNIITLPEVADQDDEDDE